MHKIGRRKDAALICFTSLIFFSLIAPVASSSNAKYRLVDLGANSAVLDITPDGSVVGEMANQGFVRDSDGSITKFSVSGACETRPQGINKSGTIVGTAYFADVCGYTGTVVGFLRTSDGTITTFPGLDGWILMLALSMDQKGTIVGIYVEVPGTTGAFIRRPDGTIKKLELSEGDLVDSISINGNGTIMGSYIENGSFHGYVQVPHQALQTFDVPGSSNTQTFAMNGQGWIAGVYGKDQKIFIRAPDGTFNLTNFTDQPNCINNSLTISGKLRPPGTGSKHAFVLASDGELQKLSAPLKHSSFSFTCINEAGVVAGTFTQGSGAFAAGLTPAYAPINGCCHNWVGHGFIAYPDSSPGRVGARLNEITSKR